MAGSIIGSCRGVLQWLQEEIRVAAAGTCEISLLVMQPPSAFGRLYRRFLGMECDVPFLGLPALEEQRLPAEVCHAASPPRALDGRYRQERALDEPARVPVRDQLVSAILERHKLDLGITLEEDSVRIWRWGTGDSCGLLVTAAGTVQMTARGMLVGPPDIEASFERIHFLLLQVEFLKLMLESPEFAGETRNRLVWDIVFHLQLPVANRKLLDRTWSQDFGNGNAVEAELEPQGEHELHLREELTVNREPLTATAEDLARHAFLCYKVFLVEFDGALPRRGRGTRSGGTGPPDLRGGGGGSIGWDWNVWSDTSVLDLSPAEGVGLTVTLEQSLDVSGEVRWRFKWFRLKKLEAYFQLDYFLELRPELEVSAAGEWALPDIVLFELDKDFFFTVWLVPVEVTLRFQAEAGAELTAGGSAEISYTAGGRGSIRAGVRWKKGRGWSPIREASFDLERELDFEYDFELSVRPRLTFSIAALFYKTAGPFVGLGPYALARLTSSPEKCSSVRRLPVLEAEVGVDLEGGITLEDWLQKAFDLEEDYSWPLANHVFWEWANCEPYVSDLWDVRIAELLVPLEEILITEPADIAVAVANRGNQTFSEVEVEISAEVGDRTVLIASPVLEGLEDSEVGLEEGEVEAAAIRWDTSVLGGPPPPGSGEEGLTCTEIPECPDRCASA